MTSRDSAEQTRGQPFDRPAGSEQDVTLVSGDSAIAALDPEPVTLRAGDKLGRYVITGRLGAGAMGIVYAAHDPELDRSIAVKVLKQLPGDTRMTSTGEVRLLREARALARLSHPNVVPVYDVGLTDDGRGPRQVYLAMQLVQGRTLREWLEKESHPWTEIVRRFIEAGRGLAAAHAARLIHRDFKPDNVLLDASGRATVMDFGLARGREGSVDDSSGSLDSVDTLAATLTRTGSVVGTPVYMAPEQHLGKVVDDRADQYSFCVALFSGLFGKRPFHAPDIHALARVKLQQKLESFEPGEVPQELVDAILRGLSRDPNARWPDMATLLDVLERAVRPRKSRRRWWAAGGIVTGVAVVSILASRPAQPCRAGEARWAEVWNPEVADHLRARFVAVSPEYGEQQFQGLERGLKQYEQEWLDGYRSVCQAVQTHPSPELDRMMACVERRRQSVHNLVEILDDPSKQSVLRSVSMVTHLPSLEACSEERNTTPASDDEARRIEAAHLWIDRARTHDAAGQPQAAVDAALAALILTQATEQPGLQATAHRMMGRTLSELGRYDDAVRHYDQAFDLATSAGDDREAIRSAAALTFTVGNRQRRLLDGLDWARRAHALLERLDRPGELELVVLENEATVLGDAGRTEEALALYERVLEIRRRDLPEDALAIAMVRNNIGTALSDLGRLDEALEMHQQVLAHRRSLLGPRHPLVAMSLANVGGVQARREHYDEAEIHIREAMEIWSETKGPEHPHVISMKQSLAGISTYQGDLETADEIMREILEVQERTSEDSVQRATAYGNLSSMLTELGRVEEARAATERAIAILQATQVPQGPDWAGHYYNLGVIAMREGDADEAERKINRALKLWQSGGELNPELYFTLDVLARLHLQEHRPEEALSIIERSFELQQKHPKSLRAHITGFLHGWALWDTGRDKAGGWELVVQAGRGFLDAPANYERERGWVRDWLNERRAEAADLGLEIDPALAGAAP